MVVFLLSIFLLQVMVFMVFMMSNFLFMMVMPKFICNSFISTGRNTN